MNQKNRRQDYRLNSRETVLLELVSANYDGSSPPELLICNSVDISANGLQISVNQPLERGLILNIAVQLEQMAPITLVTEVKWQFPQQGSDQWMTGLSLLDSDGSGLVAWKQQISERLLQED
ncbi:MAG: PilZ domain-containing protein [Gammaproteobacteria bacterium]|uniref:PilZ domain-containing protein n=1 Tax=Pseudomaricurvus alcaniphilus TaxID=1166482 RepID=UPI001407B422|nr:PilZ domain-containing protein [Pseudomaricurvus alcaniphilus]MBR9911265.1 PilZ domain-containing protein [Gammaproteobacteria bacterium]NHN37646.1 PilZ domain-containing protein [Pseudomaricurvus alcaniphilus]